MSAENASLGAVLDRLSEAEEDGTITVGDVLDDLADRSLGVIIASLGLVAALPVVGAIPGISVTIGVLVLVAIAQTAIGRTGGGGLWTPRFVREREINADKLNRGIDKIKPYTNWIDGRLEPRLTWLTTGPGRGTAMIVAVTLLAMSMIPLAVVPFGVQAPAMGLIGFGLAMMTRDGLMASAGYLLAIATVAVFAWVV